MPANNQLTASIPIGLPNAPSVADPEIQQELQFIYFAITMLQVELSKSSRFIARASEAITAGQYVAVANVSGECKVAPATAAVPPKPAVGFATSSVASGAWGVFVTSGNNQYRSGLTPASPYYLSDTTPGSVQTAKPIGLGKIVQPVGFALTATELITNINNNWTLL